MFGFLIVLLPLIFRRKALFTGKKGTLRILLYYACLGLGYMMAEIFLIQRFVLFLSEPVYANAVIITALLVSSGIGSFLSERMRVSPRAMVLGAAAGIALCALLCQFALPSLLRLLLDLPLAARCAVAALLVAPIGLLLGVPFPAGLTALSRGRSEILPWAWGLNGALSVAGSVLTRVVSTGAGFSTVLACLAVLYVTAGLLFGGNTVRSRNSS
jgi:hypothetical protein